MDARAALARLKQGNEQFLTKHRHTCDLTLEHVAELDDQGQSPFAIVLCCSDSRVSPEHVFMAGLGELFVVRVAGNIAGELEAASAIYAAQHLGAKLLLVMGHTHCGAVQAALAGGVQGSVACVTDAIRSAIGDETDPYEATVKNVRASMAALAAHPELAELEPDGFAIKGAVYDTHTGRVTFL